MTLEHLASVTWVSRCRKAFIKSFQTFSCLGFWGILAIIFSPQIQAAEHVVFKYRWLERSIPVEDLSTLAETGASTPQLNYYLDAIDQEPGDFQQTLTRSVSLDPVMLDRALNNPLGDWALDQISPAIHTQSGEGDRQAFRAALVLSASDDGQVSLIELIETYPTQEIYVEGDRLADAYEDIVNLRDRIEEWTAWFNPSSQ